jgi:peptidyl-prolyl cis-trans isomerase B (cyclophilin B)
MAKQWENPPALTIDEDRVYLVKLETTKGEVQLELYPEHAPKTVNNFVFLVKEAFYDGISFHRVIDNFMVQGGDPTGSGMGGPGYKFEDELSGNPLKHGSKVISMATSFSTPILPNPTRTENTPCLAKLFRVRM